MTNMRKRVVTAHIPDQLARKLDSGPAVWYPPPQIVALSPWRSAGRNQPTGTCADCTSSWSPSIRAQPSARWVSSSIASSAFQPSRA